jgi:hypothetical protein
VDRFGVDVLGLPDTQSHQLRRQIADDGLQDVQRHLRRRQQC